MKVSLPLLHIFVSTGLALFLSACSSQKETSLSLSPEEFQSKLSQRLKGKNSKVDPHLLLRVIPAQLETYKLAETDTVFYADASNPYTEVSRVYTQGDDLYLSIRIGDYTQDSTALMDLFQRWQGNTPNFQPILKADAHFIEWHAATDALSHSYLLHTRYVLHLQTNHPEGETMLRKGLNEMKLGLLK